MTRRTLLQSVPLLGVTPRRARFITGLYQLPKVDNPWREAADAGFDLVHVDSTREQLDLAQRHGLKAWATVGSAPAGIEKTVKTLRDHPALLFWETEDEPTYQWKTPEPRVPPEQIIAAYRLIKSLDPKRPVYLNHSPTNLVSTLRRYNLGADIVATDIYPVIPRGIREEFALWPDGQHGDFNDTSLAQVGQYARKMREVAGPERQVYLVLQAFAWEVLRDKDQDPSMVAYPTTEQLRFMAFDAIVHGVDGLLFWGLAQNPASAPIWDRLKPVARELKDLQSALSSRPVALPLKLEYHDLGHSLDRGVQWVAKGGLVIAVNEDRNPVDVTFTAPGFQKREVIPAQEARVYRLS